MFTPTALRVAAVLAALLSVAGLLLSVLAMTYAHELAVQFALSALSWVLLLWASILGFRLAGYRLYPDDYKKVGVRIYLIIVAFGVFMWFGVVAGLFLSVALLATLWGLKRNYDEWVPSEQEPTDEGA